ncbi:hypothetical protein Tco_1213991 [Tanacetum coccineum]
MSEQNLSSHSSVTALRIPTNHEREYGLWSIEDESKGSTLKQSTAEPAHYPKGYTQAIQAGATQGSQTVLLTQRCYGEIEVGWQRRLCLRKDMEEKQSKWWGVLKRGIVAIEDSNSKKPLVAQTTMKILIGTEEFDAEQAIQKEDLKDMLSLTVDASGSMLEGQGKLLILRELQRQQRMEAVIWHRRLGHVTSNKISTSWLKGKSDLGLTFKGHSSLIIHVWHVERVNSTGHLARRLKKNVRRNPLELTYGFVWTCFSASSDTRRSYCLVFTGMTVVKFSWVCDHGTGVQESNNEIEFCAKNGKSSENIALQGLHNKMVSQKERIGDSHEAC